jgi:hypothetical protein
MKSGVLKPLLPDICHAMTAIAQQADEDDGKASTKATVLNFLATMLFQTMKGHAWTSDAGQALRETALVLDAWSVYRIGRNASRYGHFEHASELFSRTVAAASSEQMYFWLTGLSQACRGEHLLTDAEENPDIVDRLAKANSSILLGISSINAATTQYKSHDFQIRFVGTMHHFLGCFLTLLDLSVTSSVGPRCCGPSLS